MGDNPSKNLLKALKPVTLKVFRFFFRGLIHFQKMNVKIADANINAQKFESSAVSSKEHFLMLSAERIKN